MNRFSHLLSSEALDAHVVPGVSVGFTLIFFAPLFAVAAVFWVYCAFARGSVVRVAKTLSTLWLVACVPAALLVLMGYAFNSDKAHPLLVIPLWVLAGLLPIWLPVVLRRAFGLEPS